MATEVAGWAYTEIAALLQDIGTFPTLEAAMQAVQRSPYHYLDFVKYKTRNGSEFVAGAIRSVTGGAATPVSSATETALEVARGADLTATAEKVKTLGIGFKEIPSGSGTAIKPTALLGVDLGIVGAAAAPLLGVALGADLYEANPELWTKISQKLLPFCYEGTTEIPTWAEIADLAWKSTIASAIIDALQELFDEEGIGVAPEVARVPIENRTGVTPFDFIASYTGTFNGGASGSTVPDTRNISGGAVTVIRTSSTGGNVIVAYSTPHANYSSFTYEGQTVYWTQVGLGFGGNPEGWFNPQIGFTSWLQYGAQISAENNAKRAWEMICGGYGDGDFPAGTSPWTGTLYDPIPEGNPLVTGSDPSTGSPTLAPQTPVSLPIPAPRVDPGMPAESPDPEEQPDPTMTTAPEEQVEPYVLPLPEPEEETDPTIQPTIPVEEDPSQPDIPPGRIVDIIPPISPPEGISPFPSLPTTPAWFDSDVGMVTVYHPTPQQMYAFSRWLWVTLSQASIQTVWNNPFDGVITAFELYCTPTDNGHRSIHSGFLDSGIDSATISRYTEINCGTLGIPEYYGNYFDYSPYSKAHIYLPFIGIQELNVDDIVGHAVNVTYRIDEYNGTCIAMITVAKVTIVNGEEVEYSNTMYQYSGNCSVELPLSGGSQAQIKAGLMMADATRQAALISAGAELIGGIGSLLGGSIGGAIGGVGDAISTLAQGEVSALGHMLSGKSTVQKSGSFGSSHGALGIKTPFIVVTRPKQIKVANYNELYGYPAHKMVTIGACEGFIRCREVHVLSPTATDDEKTLIEQLLKAGVYLSDE